MRIAETPVKGLEVGTTQGTVQPAPANWARVVVMLADARPARMLLLISALWLVNLFDVNLTILAHRQGLLEEANPLALRVLSLGPEALVIYKIVLVAIGTGMLWLVRRHRLAEVTAWGMLAAYVFVAIHWGECYEMYVMIMGGAAHLAGSGLPA
jgi:hypothetical protein